eukprot:Hpha_TRINITY_DN1623_c0_g1::TRINITY_DN1623_c0_g1_i2::g.48912::m.48912
MRGVSLSFHLATCSPRVGAMRAVRIQCNLSHQTMALKRDAADALPPPKRRAAALPTPSPSGTVVQFYSKSKNAGDLGEDVSPDWRRRLSNFWPCEILVDGRRYPSVEHAFHAAKARCSDRPSVAAAFECGGRVGKDALAAKKAGGRAGFAKAGAVLDVAKWDVERDGATMAALRARLRVDAVFRSILLRTAERGLRLVHFERQGQRSYWGGSVDPSSGEVRGRNRLGEMLMELRASLPDEEEDAPAGATDDAGDDADGA